MEGREEGGGRREEGCELSCSLKLPHWRTMSQHYLSLIVDETFYQLNKTETNTIVRLLKEVTASKSISPARDAKFIK